MITTASHNHDMRKISEMRKIRGGECVRMRNLFPLAVLSAYLIFRTAP